jgi:serine/threonine protein kinase
VAELHSGALLGEIGFITGSQRTATIEVTRECEVFSIPRMDDFLARYPGLRAFLIQTAKNRMIELSRLSNLPDGITLPATGARRSELSSRVLGGRYEISTIIGEGGMGCVYLGFDRKLDRRVAIKQLHAEAKAGSRARELFMSEARTVARLSHPYIVAVHDILDEGDELFLIMEFVDGSPLGKLIDQGRRFTLVECETLLSFVCQAVACAHWNHVLHRDLKPANIMLDRNGFAKVMDFGLAHRGLVGSARKEISGTPNYMAPEQHWGESGPGSDVYALGVSLYEMLTGKLPFSGPDYAAQKAAGKYVPPSALEPALRGTGLDEFVAAVLVPDPAKRIQGPLQFHECLKALRYS